MKVKNILLLPAALVLLLMYSCSNEEYLNPPLRGTEGFITFTIPGVKTQLQSYVSVAGSALENQIDLLDIYMFTDSTGLLMKVFHLHGSSLETAGNDLKATIDVAGRKGDHTFYFVANGKSNASDLENVSLGITTEIDFVGRLTDINTSYIETPLLMTGKHKVSHIEQAGTSVGTSNNKVKLSRRVARFDVDNDASVTNFSIDKILVENVYCQTYAFGDATEDPSVILERGKLAPISYGDSAGANGSIPMESLFYLYPTKIGNGETAISFEGDLMGQRRIYTLQNPTQIDANKRYVLRVRKVDVSRPDLTVIIEEWGDMNNIYEAKPEISDVIFSPISMTANTGVTTTGPTTTGVVTEATYNITNIQAQTTLSFTAESYSAEGSKHFIKGNANDLPGFSVTRGTAVLTYGARYAQPYTIVIPKRTDNQTEINILVEIVNQADSKQRLNIIIRAEDTLSYPGTKLLPVMVGGTLWAPINVGATEIGTSDQVKHMGKLFQWGRNVGFVYGATDDIYAVTGPVDMTVATTGAAKDKFIKGTAGTNYDWLTPQRGDLWSGNNQQGPCPDGWRIPTKAELEKIKALYITNFANSPRLSFADKRLVVTGDNGTDILYLPAAGYRAPGTGTSNSQGTNGIYWSSGTDDTRTNYLNFTASSLAVGLNFRSYGFSVRCVK